jgi:hypothetical protein
MRPHEAKSCDLIKRVCLTIRDCNLKSHPNKFLVIFGARPRPRIIAHGARPSSEYFHLRRPNVFVNYSRFVLSREQPGVGIAPVASPLELYTEVLYHAASSGKVEKLQVKVIRCYQKKNVETQRARRLWRGHSRSDNVY